MNDTVYNSVSLCAVAGSIAAIAGIEPPITASEPSKTLCSCAASAFRGERADRVFMYNPDAIALWLYQKYTVFFDNVVQNTQVALPLCSVMPSVTPVCFASMYTGTDPQLHGITSYKKPVLKTDTVFDAFIRAGKRPAIVSTARDSISMIFLERAMDYFIYETVDECNKKAHELIDADEYDLIVLYNGNYDATMHKFAPESEQALTVLRENDSTFGEIARHIKRCWSTHNTMLAFAPDHGCHEIDGECGSHGLDMAEDLNIMHFYGFCPRQA